MVHLPLFVGELSGGCGACRIHHNRAHKLAVAVLARFVEEECQERPNEPRHVADIKREARAGHFYTAAEVEHFFKIGQIPVRDGIFYLCDVSPSVNCDIVLGGFSDRNAVVGHIRDCEEDLLPALVNLGRGGFEILYAL